jgi:hypothetical protein
VTTTMSEQIPWESIIAVIGVGMGWLLSQLTDSIKNRRRETMIKRALINELSIIRKAFSGTLKKGENRITDEQYPFFTETYDSVRIELASFLKLDSLAKVQRTYEEIKKLNSEGRGHIVIAGSLDHIFQFTDFKKLITLTDDSITQLE